MGVAAAFSLIGLSAGGAFVAPAAAENEITVEPDHLVFADPGEVAVVTTQAVPADLVGEACDLRVVAENGSSIHPGNALIITTADSRHVIEGVEESADGSVVDVARAVLGETVVFEMRMGSDGMSSLGFSVTIDCPPPPTTTVPPETTTTVPPTTAAPVTAAPTVLPGRQVAAPVDEPPQVEELPEAPPARATTGSPSYTG